MVANSLQGMKSIAWEVKDGVCDEYLQSLGKLRMGFVMSTLRLLLLVGTNFSVLLVCSICRY